MKKIILFLLIIVSVLSGSRVLAQQEPIFAHSMFNQVASNPGYVGYGNAICFTGIVHQQWVGFQNTDKENIGPQTQNINIHSPIKFLHGGIGLNIINDQIGPLNEIGLKLMYAYRKDVGMGNLGIGTYIGLLNGSFTYDFHPAETGDPVIELTQGTSSMLLDIGLGIHYAIPGKFYIGLSSTRINQSKTPEEVFSYKTRRHYYLTSGYEYTFRSNPAFQINPSLSVQSDGTDYHLAIASLLKYNNKVWGGVNYGFGTLFGFNVLDPLSIMVGARLNDITVSYSYGIPTSHIGSSGTHEVMIGYCFKIDVDKGESSYRNTRFL